MTEETEMSSESTKEQGLAQEALDSTAEGTTDVTSPAESEQQGVPLAKHVALRQRAQAAEVAQARAEGELTAMRQLQTQNAPAAKSPLDLEVERQDALGIAEEDMTISPRIIRANDLYNQQVMNQATANRHAETLARTQLTSANSAKTIHDDWSDVVKAADGLLTKGELVDIAAAGADFGEIAYDKSQKALARNKPAGTNTAPQTKPSKLETVKAPTQQEILNDINADPQTIAAAQL